MQRNEKVWELAKKITWHLGHYGASEPDFNNEAIIIYYHLIQAKEDGDYA